MLKVFGNKLFFILMVCCAFSKLNAQQTIQPDYRAKLNAYQDSLLVLSDETFNAANNVSRLEKNAQFVKQLVNALKINGSFDYDFDSLKRISVIKSPDRSFRLLTWFIPTDEGTYRYYGTIQMATSNGSLKLFPLTDYTSNLSDVNAITSNKNWFGARYYEILPITANGKAPYYLLLGWKGNDQKTSKKVIDVLSFENAEVQFGKNIFETVKGKPLKNRVIFEYNKLNSMTLTFNKEVNMIVFDHLVPYDPKMVGNFEFYASDLSFDGYKLNYGKLSLSENIPLKNGPSANDEFYGRPVKASTVNHQKP